MKTYNKQLIVAAVIALGGVLVAGCSTDDSTGGTDTSTGGTDATTGDDNIDATAGDDNTDATTGDDNTDATTGDDNTDASMGTDDDASMGTDDTAMGQGDAMMGMDADGPDEDAGSTDEVLPTCEGYCATVTANCTDENAQYGSESACISYCQTAGAIPVGATTDTGGNTVGCRAYHADVAGSAPADGSDDDHCGHAGPSGGAVCGSWCENYCHLAMTNCTGDYELYADNDACMAACDGITVGGDANPASVTSGDSVECRIYHLGVAGTEGDTSAEVHCPHGQAEATAPCVDPVAGFDFRDNAADEYDRVDRAGMPAINTAVIASKDAYNAAGPADDAAGTFVPEIVASVEFLHDALDDDLTALGLVPCVPADCVAFAAPLVVPDVLKHDLSSDAGFANGRMLTDPVIDVTLAVVLLDIAGGSHGLADLVGALNPTENDVPVLDEFPYVAAPHSL